MAAPIRAALRSRLTAAMRARDRQTADAMRSVIATLENAEAPPTTGNGDMPATTEHFAGAAQGLGATEAPRKKLSPADERALVEREVAELRSAVAVLAAAGEDERAAELTRAARAVEAVLRG